MRGLRPPYFRSIHANFLRRGFGTRIFRARFWMMSGLLGFSGVCFDLCCWLPHSRVETPSTYKKIRVREIDLVPGATPPGAVVKCVGPGLVIRSNFLLVACDRSRHPPP